MSKKKTVVTEKYTYDNVGRVLEKVTTTEVTEEGTTTTYETLWPYVRGIGDNGLTYSFGPYR